MVVDPLRVWLINYEFPPVGGGAGNATRYIARELVAFGYDVTVLTAAYQALPRYEQQEGYIVRRVRARRRRADCSTPLEMFSFLVSATVAALWLAHRERPDVTIAFFGIPSGPVSLALKVVYGAPYLVSLRGGDVPGFQPYDLALYHKLTYPFIRLIWRHASRVIANSHGLRNLAQQSAPSLEIAVISNGVDVETFAVERRLPGNHVKLLFVGRVVRQKGLNYLLDALASLSTDLPFHLEIVGEGDEVAELRTHAEQIGLQVQFSGWLPREALPQKYTQADIFVLPSLDEGMPNVVLEAMAAGLPIVATDIAGTEELVVNSENGYLVPPRDSVVLAERLRHLILSSELRERMGQASRSRAQSFSWRAVGEKYAALIRKATQEAG